MRLTFTPRARLSPSLVAVAICFAGACTSTPTNTNIANRSANSNTAGAVAPQGTPAPTPAATVAAAPPQGDVPHPEIRRISVEETQALLAKNEAVAVDTRSASVYETEHIKGALNVTGGDLEAKLKSLPRDKKIVTYCT